MTEVSTENRSQPTPKQSRVGLFRRLAAMFYDGLLSLAVLFAATAALLPFTDGEAVAEGPWWYRVYLLGVVYVYFAWFWTHGGQTLGMKAWKFRVRPTRGGDFTWGQALVRYLAALVSWAPAGLGHLWIFLDRNGYAWHDHLSKSELVTLKASGKTAHEPKPDAQEN